MAPSPEILKRKRSQPSDWWANNASSTPQKVDDTPPAREIERTGERRLKNSATQGLVEREERGNRGVGKGKKKRGKGEADGDEDELGGEEVVEKENGVGRKNRGRRVDNPSGAGEQRQDEDHVVRRRGRPAAINMESDDLVEEQDEMPVARRRGRPAAIHSTADEIEEQDIEQPINKRRRGRPSNSIGSVIVDQSSQNQAEPKKRGRPSITNTEKPRVEDIPLKKSKSLKRGRPSNTEAELQASTQSFISTPEEPRRRGRRSAPESEHDTTLEEGRNTLMPKKRRRAPAPAVAPESHAADDAGAAPKKKKARLSEAERLEEEASSSMLPIEDLERVRKRNQKPDSNMAEPEPATVKERRQERGRRRTRSQDDEARGEHASSTAEKENRSLRARKSDADTNTTVPALAKTIQKPPDPRRGRPLASNIEIEAASSSLTKDRSGRKKRVQTSAAMGSNKTSITTQASQKSSKSSRTSNVGSQEDRATKSTMNDRRGSKRTSQGEKTSKKRREAENLSPKPSKRRRTDDEPQEQDDQADAIEFVPLYQHLRAVTRKVSHRAIEAKWEPLPPNCVDRISQLLQDIQRPVVARINDERKKAQASTALHMVSRRLVSKITKGLPFPQGSRGHREDDFDFEKILDHNRVLEAQLTPALHANELLEAELRKEHARLESDRRTLEQLESNASRETAARKQAARKLHPLLQGEGSLAEVQTQREDSGLISKTAIRPLDTIIQGDDKLQALAQDLNGHVDSIQGNIKQVHGITEAMAKSKAAVQATLFNHLDPTQYETVVLGMD